MRLEELKQAAYMICRTMVKIGSGTDVIKGLMIRWIPILLLLRPSCQRTGRACHDSREILNEYMYELKLLSHLLSEIALPSISQCACRVGNAPDIEPLDNRPEDMLVVGAEK
jgi:hypothetical protein